MKIDALIALVMAWDRLHVVRVVLIAIALLLALALPTDGEPDAGSV